MILTFLPETPCVEFYLILEKSPKFNFYQLYETNLFTTFSHNSVFQY